MQLIVNSVLKPMFTNRARNMILVIGIVFCINSFGYQTGSEAIIVQGDFSHITDFPYSAYTGVTRTVENDAKNVQVSWICGSSILNQRILLTAAHCVHNCQKSSSMIVQYGDEDRVKSMKTMVMRYVNHPEYSEDDPTQFDIALLMVEEPLKLTERVGRVALLNNPPYDEIGLIAGWGYVDEIQQIRSSKLKHTSQKIMSRALCQRALGKTLAKGLICGREKNSNNYPSRGDSGSALIVRGYIQVGLLSCKCPNVRSIAIYTDVGYYYSWIIENSIKLLCS